MAPLCFAIGASSLLVLSFLPSLEAFCFSRHRNIAVYAVRATSPAALLCIRAGSNHKDDESLLAGDTAADEKEDELLLDRILQVALEASQKAAAIIADNDQGADVEETKSTSRDLLTLIDPLCEKTIKETVMEQFPEHAFLGEEGVEPGVEAAKVALEEKLELAGWLWIVDPVDGTTNFASGLPINAPSVAVAYNGEIMVGVVVDPHRAETWTAVRGRGAFLNFKPIQTTTATSPTSIGDAVIGAESPAGQKSLEVALKGIQVLMPQCRTIRILGSTAVQLPWVAQGEIDELLVS